MDEALKVLVVLILAPAWIAVAVFMTFPVWIWPAMWFREWNDPTLHGDGIRDDMIKDDLRARHGYMTKTERLWKRLGF